MEFSNSPLTAYTQFSPNHSGQRTHTIDRITPHCVVGQVSAEALGAWFAKRSTQASCNYGIDKDGRVALIVEEKNRSWCSSSSANDQRAVTIECASDTTEPYAFRDVVYQSLVRLCADVCKRNGKNKLLWISDKADALAYVPKEDEMLLTVHRWFAAKSCPGGWLMARMDRLAAEVSARLTSDGQSMHQESRKVAESSGSPDSAETIWKRLYAAIRNAYGVAGLMGNLYAESGLLSTNLQSTGNTKLGMTDEEYTAAVDSGVYTADQFVHDGFGYGLAQWTYYARKSALLAFANDQGKSIGDLETQVDFLLQEIKGYETVWNTLTAATSVRSASDAVLLQFERPADQSESMREKRSGFGEDYYKRFAVPSAAASTEDAGQKTIYYRVRKSWQEVDTQIGAFTRIENARLLVDANPGYAVFDESGNVVYGGEAQFTQYCVKVDIPDLNIRETPSVNSARRGFIKPGVYTIVEEENGWGRLKSGAGWIKLSYTARI